MTDDRLRALYALILDRRPGFGAVRISIDRILALVERRGGEPDRLRTLDAVMADRDHMAELEVLWAATGSRDARTRKPLWALGTIPLAAAASVILVIGVTLLSRWTARPEATRGGIRSTVQLVAPAERVNADPITFSWKPVSDARDYEIEVLDADGLSTFVSTVRATSVQLPASVHLIPGAEYRWWVVARRADGSRIGAVPRRLRIGDGRGGGGSARTGPVSPIVVLS